MEKNNFLIYNDIVYTLYQCKSYEALRDEFLPRLRLLIPFTYASIISVNPENRTEIVPTPVCFPDYFYEAELLYIDHMSEDHLLWINNVRESQLVRESDLVNDDVRLNSSLYQHCYQKFHVYDSLQYSMICSGEFSGILTLFRTKIDGDFTDDDMFFFRSLGKHINVTYEQILYPEKEKGHTALANRIPALAKGYDLGHLVGIVSRLNASWAAVAASYIGLRGSLIYLHISFASRIPFSEFTIMMKSLCSFIWGKV